MAEQGDYKFGEQPRDGSINDPSLKEYNIFELAEAEADRRQNRQAEERKRMEELRALREQLLEPVPGDFPSDSEPSVPEVDPDAG